MFLQMLCVGLIALLFGLVVCFSGYRFFLFLLPIWGFFAGFGLGAGLVTLIFSDGFLATITGWVLGFVVGLVFAVLSYLFWVVGVALFAGSVGYMLGAGLIYWLLPDANLIAFLVGMVGAVIVAFMTLLLNLQKVFVVLVTATGGATTIMMALMLFIGRIELADLGTNAVRAVIDDSFLWLVLWLVVAALGIASQLFTARSYVIEVPEGQRAW